MSPFFPIKTEENRYNLTSEIYELKISGLKDITILHPIFIQSQSQNSFTLQEIYLVIITIFQFELCIEAQVNRYFRLKFSKTDQQITGTMFFPQQRHHRCTNLVPRS